MSRYQYQPLESWDEFERLCCDLFKNEWDSFVTSLNGRNGSRQNGVDIYGYPGGGQEIWGIQCKGKEIYPEKKITIKQISEEIDKAIGFEPKLTHYIFATTMKRDIELQRELRKLVSKKTLPFSVSICFWDDIENYLNNDSHTADKYYRCKDDDIKKNGLFDRNSFNDRVNLIVVDQGEKDDELVFNCEYYNLCGLIRNNEIWLDFYWNHCFFPRRTKFIKNARIDTKRIAELVEKFHFNKQVDGFSVNYNLTKSWGTIQICNKEMIMSGDYYVSNSDVYNDTDCKIDEYQTAAFFEIFGVLQEVVATIKE